MTSARLLYVENKPACPESLVKDIEGVCEGFDEERAALIKRAFLFACEAHKGQERMSKEPYITHSVWVAKLLKEMRMDAATICAGLLHDIIEDTPYTVEDIKKTTNENVAFLVEGVSHVTAKVFKTQGQVFSESLKKMFLAMAKDIRVIIIKLADRLHNMRTIQYLPEERQRPIAEETMNIYAPLAHRLGIAKVKSELEDISFSVLNPGEYRKISLLVAEKKDERAKRIEEIQETIRKELDRVGIKAEITGRPKHLYSVFQKMTRENKGIGDIYDLIALRIITDTVTACYTILGTIHNIWKPVPGRFKDFIAMPKSNMYQSLHTTVLDKRGRAVEIQIRTKEMDEIAEEGIAAHWNYKEDRNFDRKTDSAFVWLRQLLEWQSSLRGGEEFIKELKIDLFEEEVFVFTPKGEVKELIRGATVLDFAYSVHSDLGDKCAGAKVNGKWVTIKYELKNGDIIEVVKSPGQHPAVDWLKTVKTSKAKNRIRHWLRTNQNLQENMEKGKNLLSGALAGYKLKPDDITEEIWKNLTDYYNLKSREDLLAGIGYGEFSEAKTAKHIFRAIKGADKEERHARAAAGTVEKGGVLVDGKYPDIDYRFARCCNPVPGDAITGIVTKKGISIHRTSCVNTGQERISAPLVNVMWEDGSDGYYMAKLKVSGDNRDGFVNDLVVTASANKAFISSISTTVLRGFTVNTELFIRVKGQNHLTEIINALKKVKNVNSVERRDV